MMNFKKKEKHGKEKYVGAELRFFLFIAAFGWSEQELYFHLPFFSK